MTFSFFDDAPTGAVTGGVRQLQVYLQVNGANLTVLDAEAIQRAARESSTLSATIALDDNPGFDEDFWLVQAPIQAALFVSAGGLSGTLVSGKLDKGAVDLDTRTVKVSGRDMSGALHEMKASKSWINQTPSQIVQELAGMAGLAANASGLSLMAGKLFQIDYTKIANDVSLSQIIHKLGEFEGARWWVKDSTLYYQPPDQATGAYPVVYSKPQNGGPAGGNFLKLNIDRNMVLAQGATVNVAGWHQKKEQTIKSTQGSGPATYNFEIHNLEQDHADQYAKAKHSDIMLHQFTVTAEMVGDPTIDIGQQLSLSGTPADNTYTIDSIHHQIGDHGYTMTIEARGSSGGS